MELTREKVKNWLSRTERGGLFESKIVSDLCTALLEEMDKPKVWENAPEKTTAAYITWVGANGRTGAKIYERQLPKSRIDEIAEEYAKMAVIQGELSDSYITEYVEKAILKYKAELEAGR